MSSETNSAQEESELPTKGESADAKMIEIERKFVVTGDASERILNAGGHYHGEVTLCDKYFDNEKYDLTQKDYWLRQRNDQWGAENAPLLLKIDRIPNARNTRKSEKNRKLLLN